MSEYVHTSYSAEQASTRFLDQLDSARTAYKSYMSDSSHNAKIMAWQTTERVIQTLKAKDTIDVDSDLRSVALRSVLAEVYGMSGSLNLRHFQESNGYASGYLEDAVTKFQTMAVILGAHKLEGWSPERIESTGSTMIRFAPQGAIACRILGGNRGSVTKTGIAIADLASRYAEDNPGEDEVNSRLARRAQMLAHAPLMPAILQGPAIALAFRHEFSKPEW